MDLYAVTNRRPVVRPTAPATGQRGPRTPTTGRVVDERGAGPTLDAQFSLRARAPGPPKHGSRPKDQKQGFTDRLGRARFVWKVDESRWDYVAAENT